MSEKRFMYYNVIGLLCAIWFLLFGWVWVYFANLIFVFPFAILGFFLWRKGRGAENKILNKVVGWMLLAGLVSSVGALIAFSLFN